jgi:phosphatidylglycerol---prolipoprotein diacylglyceryl transferase
LQRFPGMLFFVYLIFNGVERFFIEKVRVNDLYTTLGLEYTQAQFIAIVLMLIGLSGVLFLYRKNRD